MAHLLLPPSHLIVVKSPLKYFSLGPASHFFLDWTLWGPVFILRAWFQLSGWRTETQRWSVCLLFTASHFVQEKYWWKRILASTTLVWHWQVVLNEKRGREKLKKKQPTFDDCVSQTEAENQTLDISLRRRALDPYAYALREPYNCLSNLLRFKQEFKKIITQTRWKLWITTIFSTKFADYQFTRIPKLRLSFRWNLTTPNFRISE